MNKKIWFDIIKRNFEDMTDILYEWIREMILANGGFVNVSNGKGNTIYSLELVDDEFKEIKIVGLKVESYRIKYSISYNHLSNIKDADILEKRKWYDLKCTDNYYYQTLINIFENLGEYLG